MPYGRSVLATGQLRDNQVRKLSGMDLVFGISTEPIRNHYLVFVKKGRILTLDNLPHDAHHADSLEKPQKALRGGIPDPYLEPLTRTWSHFVGIYRQKLTKSSKNDF